MGRIIGICGTALCVILALLAGLHALPTVPAWIIFLLVAGAFAAPLLG